MPRTSPASLRLLPATVLAAAIVTGAPAQSPGWSPRPAFVPSGATLLTGSAMLATDVARGQIVSFGAYPQGGTIADTWEWGGTVWTPRPSTPVPPRRVGAQLVNDPVRRRTVLFGGSDPGTINLRGDTWEWDGAAWVQRTLPASPSPRERYGIAFDAARGRIVLHAGRIDNSGIGAADTWEYDGVTWIPRPAAGGPSWRVSHKLAYDAVRQRTVMFGGHPYIQTETWEWDGTSWQLRPSGVAPPSVADHVLVYDAARQRTVLTGGYSYALNSENRDTWEWDGTVWVQRAVTLPFPATDAPVATDPAIGAALAFHSGTVWRWNGGNWVAQQTTSWPPMNAINTAACTDTVRNRVVSLGRWTSTAAVPLTWEWDGSTWTRRTGIGPTIAAGGALAFDAGRSRTVLFGASQTWEWDGIAWVQHNPATIPPVRSNHGMAYDAARQRVVLFGGEYYLPMQGPQYRGDTWTWDGVLWVQQVVVGPSSRSNYAMAYDPVRQRVVLFGGNVMSSLFDDTWEWNGVGWAGLLPAVRPSGRLGSAMTYDAASSAVVLFGGAGATTSQLFNDTWQWNGTTWSQLVTARSPAPRYWHGLATDPVTGQVLLQGGIDFHSGSSFGRDDTWLLGTPVPATATTLGSACAAGAPPVLASGTPYLGNTDFRLEVLGTAASAPCLVGFSFTTQPQPFGPCTLWLQNAVGSVFTLANAWGVARAPVALPYAPWLRGVTFTAQAAVLQAPGAWSGLDFTAARTIVIGE